MDVPFWWKRKKFALQKKSQLIQRECFGNSSVLYTSVSGVTVWGWQWGSDEAGSGIETKDHIAKGSEEAKGSQWKRGGDERPRWGENGSMRKCPSEKSVSVYEVRRLRNPMPPIPLPNSETQASASFSLCSPLPSQSSVTSLYPSLQHNDVIWCART